MWICFFFFFYSIGTAAILCYLLFKKNCYDCQVEKNRVHCRNWINNSAHISIQCSLNNFSVTLGINEHKICTKFDICKRISSYETAKRARIHNSICLLENTSSRLKKVGKRVVGKLFQCSMHNALCIITLLLSPCISYRSVSVIQKQRYKSIPADAVEVAAAVR